MKPWLAILPNLFAKMTINANAVRSKGKMYQRGSFHLFTTIKIIATRRPIPEQSKPPREPVKSSANRQVSAAAERRMIFKARASLARNNNNMRIVENRIDCAEEKARQNHKIAPDPRKVAAVL